jgi:hypothetical protein
VHKECDLLALAPKPRNDGVAADFNDSARLRIKTRCLLSCADTAVMLFRALLESGPLAMRRVDGRWTARALL